jgi:hypothetical protein
MLKGGFVGFVIASIIFIIINKFELSLFTKSGSKESSEKFSSRTAEIVVAGGAGSATSGKLFKGEKIRSFESSKKIFHVRTNIQLSIVPSTELKCSKWSVVTTIFEPSDAVKKQAHMAGIGERDCMGNRYIYIIYVYMYQYTYMYIYLYIYMYIYL